MSITLQPPVGISDFRKLVETKDSKGQQYLFVDKSLFIKEILDDLTEVKLISRPRRFGKTLNMTMLQHFLASEVNAEPTKHLFDNLKIAEHKEYIERHQGKYPVIFVTFKDMVKENDYETAYNKLCKIISRLYSEHQYLLTSQKLGNYQKKVFESVLEERATEASLQSSLLDLTRSLALHHESKPWVLIDEYDTPIQTAYFGGYYKSMIETMKAFLGSALKDNVYLEKAVLTGILRVSKESLFSTVNNIITYSLMHPTYSPYFGFTENEVTHLLRRAELNDHIDSIRDWYNGYQMGETTLVYNPWSIVNYIKERGKLGAYWVNISDNVLLRDLFIKSSDDFKSQFQSILQEGSVDTFVSEYITFNNLQNNDASLWSLLLMSGYLKAKVIEHQSLGSICQLQIPNKEVKDSYRNLISMWLSGTSNPTVFNQLIVNLLIGKMGDFSELLQRILLQSFSMHDVKGKEPEKFFHGFMLGLLAGIDQQEYQIQSNKESGYGRFDIAIIPQDPKRLGIVIEVKSVSDKSKDLKEAAIDALHQVDQQEYTTVLTENHIMHHLKIGVAFRGKELAIVHSQT